jgi:predicted transcriptional regulator of viral defense system
MSEEWRFRLQERYENAKLLVARMAGRQRGRVTTAQLQAIGVGRAVIVRWARDGYLHRRLRGVYAVGLCAPSTEADLAAALLYAGPGAMLSHATAAWWWGLIDQRPRTIHLSTPRRCKSLKGIRVHGRRTIERVWHRGLPVTPVPQTCLDYATVGSLRSLRRALAEAEYQQLLELADVEAVLRRGRAGSARLRQALASHQPRLAHTRSPLEEDFLELCERYALPLPEFNVRMHGFTVDALWREPHLVVEVDGERAHGTPMRVEHDRARDLTLRRAGYTVLRYSRRQVSEQPALVAADVRHALTERNAA